MAPQELIFRLESEEDSFTVNREQSREILRKFERLKQAEEELRQARKETRRLKKENERLRTAAPVSPSTIVSSYI